LNFHSNFLCAYAISHIGKSVYNTSAGIQNEIFIEMTILKPLVYQIHGQSLYINTKLASIFGAKLIVKINYYNATFTISVSVKV